MAFSLLKPGNSAAFQLSQFIKIHAGLKKHPFLVHTLYGFNPHAPMESTGLKHVQAPWKRQNGNRKFAAKLNDFKTKNLAYSKHF